jgi:rRNA processing protein Gar1
MIVSELEIKHVLKSGYALARIEKPDKIPALYSTISIKTGESKKNEFGMVVDIIGNTKAPYALVKLGCGNKKDAGEKHGRKKDRVY